MLNNISTPDISSAPTELAIRNIRVVFVSGLPVCQQFYGNMGDIVTNVDAEESAT